MSGSLASEISEIARIAADFSRRRDVTHAERLAYHRRKAALLTVIADRDRNQEAREVAENAWQQVRDLEASQ